MTDALVPTDRTRVRRKADRADYHRDQLHAVLDEAVWCTVGFVVDGSPRVIPTLHVRVDDRLYLHGAVGNATLAAARDGEVCVTATVADGLVLARSWFHHSVNYRSVVVLGRPRAVDDPGEKLAALEALVEHVVPGRSRDSRPPTASELRATAVVCLDIDEASGKVRTGPPVDDDADLALDVWAGVLPLRLVAGAPVADEGCAGTPVPGYLASWSR